MVYPRRMRSLVVTLLLALCGTAVADDTVARTAEIKKLMRAQADAMIADSHDAFDKTLAKDPLVNLQDNQAPNTGYSIQTDLMNPSKVTFGATRIGWAGTWGWVAAEVQLTNRPHPEMMQQGRRSVISPKMRHWIAVFVLDGGAVKTKFMVLQQTKPDRDLSGFNYVDELPVPDSLGPVAKLLEQPVSAVKLLSKDPATVAFGTSAADRGLGAAAAAKLMKRWGKLSLQVVDSYKGGSSRLDEHFEVTIGDATVAWAQIRMRPAKPAIVLTGVAITRKTAAGMELLVFAYGARD